jgi:23S rRNA pseudouridine2457 synthase
MIVVMSKIILFNKPFNVLCQFTDKEKRATLADYMDMSGVYPAGRLDYDSEGLLILTDDGKLQHHICHPSSKLAKTYWVQVEKTPTETDLDPLRTGIKLNDGPCRPAKVKLIPPPTCWPRDPPIRQRQNIPTQWLEIEITEGRNRQVRRMTAALGFPTLRLVRVSVGQWTIADILPGQHRALKVHSSRAIPQRHRHSNTPRRRRTV